jgi:hypothetical protein
VTGNFRPPEPICDCYEIVLAGTFQHYNLSKRPSGWDCVANASAVLPNSLEHFISFGSAAGLGHAALSLRGDISGLVAEAGVLACLADAHGRLVDAIALAELEGAKRDTRWSYRACRDGVLLLVASEDVGGDAGGDEEDGEELHFEKTVAFWKRSVRCVEICFDYD